MKLGAAKPVSVPGLSSPVGGEKLAVIAGPCALESLELGLQVGQFMAELTARLGLPYIFKASFDKANRTSLRSKRGPGIERGLQWLAEIRSRLGVPVLTDIHEAWQAEMAAEAVDVLQIPAFLCRQTDLLVAAAKTGKPVNIKKGQFLAPDDVRYAIEKVTGSGGQGVMVTERGTCFGYHDLVVDMRGLVLMRGFGHPVIFDITHSLQQPGGAAGASGGQRRFAAALARAAVACGVDGLFIEVHPEPEQAISDAATQLPLDSVEPLLRQCLEIRRALSEMPPTQWDEVQDE